MFSWARIAELILTLLNWATEQISVKQRKDEGKDAQKEADKINTNPAGWFNEHFDSGVRAQEPSTKSNTNKASNNSSTK